MSVGSVAAKSGQLSLHQVLAYTLPHMPSLSFIVPINIIHGIYVKHYGFSLTTIAAVVLSLRLFDAISDPVIGYLSDRYQLKYGTRRPFIILGGLLLVVAGCLLYIPPENASILYISGCLFLFYIAWTLFEVPHLAWGGELATSSSEKTRIYSYRNATGYGGSILFYSIPLLPFFATTEITLETLRWFAIIAASMMLPMLYFCVRYVPDGRGRVIEIRPEVSSSKLTVLLKILYRNIPSRIFWSAHILIHLGIGMWYGLIYIYVDSYLKAGAEFAKVFFLAFLLGLAATPLWYRLATWLGRRKCLALAIGFIVSSFIWGGMLTPDNVSFKYLVVLKAINTLGLVCLTSLLPSQLSDIVDYGRWKFHDALSATYFSVYSFIMKSCLSAGGGLGLAVAGWYGFDPNSAQHSAQSIFGLHLASVWIPAGLVLSSLLFVALTPITSRRHKAIIRQLGRNKGHRIPSAHKK